MTSIISDIIFIYDSLKNICSSFTVSDQTLAFPCSFSLPALYPAAKPDMKSSSYHICTIPFHQHMYGSMLCHTLLHTN